jgi:catechol 2,3-dioxygenase-like lactoylglutathione lyase family enzyme
MNLHRLAHVVLRVDDVDAALEFYGRALGLVEVARAHGTAYLTGRTNAGWDLALTTGGRGLDHFAFVAGGGGGV